MNRIAIAKKIEMSPGHLSDILNGHRPCGNKTAKKFGNVCDRDWTDFLKMLPDKIEKTLINSLSKPSHLKGQKQEAA